MAGHIKRRKYRRRDGSMRETWRARYPDPDPTKPGTAQIERSFPTKREAQRWLAQQAASVSTGMHVDPRRGDRPFTELTAAWRETWVDLEPKTQLGYSSILRGLEKRFASAKVAELSPDVLQAWVNDLAERRQPNTVRRQFTVMRAVMRVAVERRYLAANPCDAVKLPKKQRGGKRERLFLSPHEVRALAEAIAPHYRALVYTAAYTGLRAGELGGLRRRDVDLLHGVIRVERALKEVSGRLVFGEPKSAASRRTVSLPEPIRDLLADHLAEPAPGGTGPDDLVFTTPSGKPIRHNLFYKRQFKTAVARALPAAKHGLRFHDLRHTCASLSLAVAPNLHAVKERLGHEDIRTTINTYGHLVPSVDAALADGLGRFFTEATAPPENIVALPRA